jgi:Gpi18-like mannosyltransferase
MLHWMRQGNVSADLTFGATNWYQWLSNDSEDMWYSCGIALSLIITVFIGLAMKEPSKLAPKDWFITTSLLSVLSMPYFLPGMHERYFYAADVFSLVYGFLAHRGWRVTLLVQFASFFTYLPYLFQKEPVPRPMLTFATTIALGMVACRFARSIIGYDEETHAETERSSL